MNIFALKPYQNLPVDNLSLVMSIKLVIWPWEAREQTVLRTNNRIAGLYKELGKLKPLCRMEGEILSRSP